MRRLLVLLSFFCVIMLGAGEHKNFPAAEVVLNNGLDIIANSAAAENAAEKLSSVLEKIYNKPFPVKKGDGTSGIAIGMPEDFPAAPFQASFDN